MARPIPNPPHVGPDLLDLLTTVDNYKGLPFTRCPHSPNPNNGGWTLEVDPESPFKGKWVHAADYCRLPSRLAVPEE